MQFIKVSPMRFLVTFFCLFSCISYTQAASHQDFHPPTTTLEKRLDEILHSTEIEMGSDEPSALDYVLQTPYKNHKYDSKYADFFSQAFVRACANKEKELVDRDCGGNYIRGEQCGMDYDPIVCAQDFTDSYVYSTLMETDKVARIEYKWHLTDDNPMATYKLIKQGNSWVIDGVKCTTGDSFNMDCQSS